MSYKQSWSSVGMQGLIGRVSEFFDLVRNATRDGSLSLEVPLDSDDFFKTFVESFIATFGIESAPKNF